MFSKPKIVVGKFLMETFFKDGPHGIVTPEILVEMVELSFYRARQAHREGILYVGLPMLDMNLQPYWKSNIVQLKGGEYLFGRCRARVEGEDPRKSVSVLGGEPMPAVRVDAILYHRNVLDETEPMHRPFDYEIVKVNICVTENEQPMPPETLIANHYGFSGGTSTNMSPEEFEKALRESATFWKDKAYIHNGG